MSIDWTKYTVSDSVEVATTWPAKGSMLVIGDSIEGRFIDLKENIGPNKSKMYVLETDDGVVGVWGGTVLDTKFASIPVGKMVAIEYVGEKKGKGARNYKDFKVGVGNDYIGDESNKFEE